MNMNRVESMSSKSMRRLGNTLVWVGLTVGLPGALYALTAAPTAEDPVSIRHNPAKCAVCRHYRGLKNVPPQIIDEDMILVSPGHTASALTEDAGDPNG
jgi:hypothetical protein